MSSDTCVCSGFWHLAGVSWYFCLTRIRCHSTSHPKMLRTSSDLAFGGLDSWLQSFHQGEAIELTRLAKPWKTRVWTARTTAASGCQKASKMQTASPIFRILQLIPVLWWVFSSLCLVWSWGRTFKFPSLTFFIEKANGLVQQSVLEWR